MYSIVFQDREEIVAVVSIKANEYALSVVPLVVNSILENHLFLVDTVVIVHPNHFPRSRFGDKMRRRAKALFVDKKLYVDNCYKCKKKKTNIVLFFHVVLSYTLSVLRINTKA